MEVDKAKTVFDGLIDGWLLNRDTIETEQDTRFHVIDRMLTEILGWERIDVKTESSIEAGYIDYLLRVKGRNRFVVEAKKASRILIDTRSPRVSSYLVGGPALKSAEDGLKQAKRYCFDTGVPFAVLTSGFEWIAFWAIRTDGTPPMEGKAIVFPSIDSIRDNFALFYDLFSKDGVIQSLYQVHIHEAEGLSIQHSESLESVIGPSEVRLLPKSRMAVDLENVFKRFFSKLSGESDPEMLVNCFVESKESREADTSLQKIARNLINRIDVITAEDGGNFRTTSESLLKANVVNLS
jgi:predicted type IV restriction endonuclease